MFEDFYQLSSSLKKPFALIANLSSNAYYLDLLAQLADLYPHEIGYPVSKSYIAKIEQEFYPYCFTEELVTF